MKWHLIFLFACSDSMKSTSDFNFPEENASSGEVLDCEGGSPESEEICDGIDNNCDGQVDEDLTTTFYADADSDGFGSPDDTVSACEVPEGYTMDATDCDDTDPEVYPDAPEFCDGVDNNCDGDPDDGAEATWYPDLDEDGYGDSTLPETGCSPGPKYTTTDGDCDDTNSEVSPGGVEVCDGLDNNCDQQIDEGVLFTFYKDSDGDGFGSPEETMNVCEPTDGLVENSEDCDDSDSYVNPDAAELCDSVDNNCDGVIDEDGSADGTAFYLDSDGDGYGDRNSQIQSCDIPSGYVDNFSDCDDSSADVSPSSPEFCNSQDDDCDGTVDESDAFDAVIFYVDNDGDGFGDPNQSSRGCVVQTGHVIDSTDCDDANNSVNPGASEICNGSDDNCDGNIDETLPQIVYYSDSDGDGFGDPYSSQTACQQPFGMVSDSSDCDDSDPNVNPDALEICDLLDNDCDGQFEVGTDASCPAESCLEIIILDPGIPDGVYWIDPDGIGSYEAYCDMSTDSGGWTLLLKTSGAKGALHYAHNLWTNNNLLNENSLNTSTSSTAKLQAYLNLPIEELNGCFPTQNGHCIYAEVGPHSSAKELFSGNTMQIGSGFNGQMNNSWSHQNHCNYFGVNTPHSTRARFGFSSNNENNCNSNDSAIGFGLGTGSNSGWARYSSGMICDWYCTNGDAEVGFPGLLWGR